jgi:hypothetical protein
MIIAHYGVVLNAVSIVLPLMLVEFYGLLSGNLDIQELGLSLGLVDIPGHLEKPIVMG